MTEIEQELEAIRAKSGAQKENTTVGNAATVKQMQDIIVKIADLRDREAKMSRAKKEVTSELEAAERDAISLLDANKLTNFRSAAGLISVSHRTSVKTPKTTEAKEAFFAYLKKLDRYDDMISVNSQTLNSFYKEQFELAKERGDDDFEIPGLNEVNINAILSFKSPRG